MTSSPLLSRVTPVGVVAQFPQEKRSDASLVAGAAAGEREAFRAIWDRYVGLVRGVLYGALGPDMVIDDLVQEVFVGLVRGVARIEDGAALRGYLASMAVRQAAMEIRKRKVRRWVGLSTSGELPEQSTPGADHEQRAALACLQRILEKLSTRRRMAFVLRHVEGLEMLEAARALDVSESTLRRELAFARKFVSNAAAADPILNKYLAHAQGVWS